MIQLYRTSPPEEMTEKWVQEQTNRFKLNKDLAVWNVPFLKKALLELSHTKCAYSEIRLQEEGKSMEVEHFLPKSEYEDKVLEWDNLLPSSRHCNNAKRDKNPEKYPIVHPIRDNPKDHFYLIDYVFRGKTQKGRNAAIILKLNDLEQLVEPRRAVGLATRESLYRIYEKTKSLIELPPETELSLIESLEKIMIQGTKKHPYSATVATILLNDPHYQVIKIFFQKHGLWSPGFEELETQVQFCELDTMP